MAFFGADVIERKFGLEPPADWTAAVESLNDTQLRAGVETISKSGRAYPPTLPEFIAACRTAREFTRPITGALPDGRFDGWERAGNLHLMAYLKDRGAPKRYAPDSTYHSGPGPQTRERTMCLLRAKHRWAQLMREGIDGNGEVEVDHQKAVWKAEMAVAEREIDALIQQESRRAA